MTEFAPITDPRHGEDSQASDYGLPPINGHYEPWSGPFERPANPTRSLPLVEAKSFAGKPIPSRLWHVEGLIPAGTVTVLGGDGGTGKSLLAKQLAVSTTLGRPWIGREVRQGACLFLSAEDDLDEIHRRLADIVSDLAVTFDDLTKLDIVSLAGEDAVLGALEGKANIIRPTPLFEAVKSHVLASKPVLVVLDTLSDLFAGDENQRAQARQFVGLLRGLALQSGAAVLLLAHPSLSGMASGSGSSGSTAWNNSVRSRQYFERIKQENGAEDDPDVRVLKVLKANYGTTGGEIRVRWLSGVFTPETSAGAGLSAVAAHARADRVFLALIDAYEADGRYVSQTPSANYAPVVFARDPRSEGIGKDGLIRAMNRLFAASAIRVVDHGPPSRRLRRLTRC